MSESKLEFGDHGEREDEEAVGPFPPEPAPDPHAAAMAAGMGAVEKALGFLPPTPQQTAEYLESEVIRFRDERDSARLERDAAEATLAMTVARLGGVVEGEPTHRINFLQRVDELREIERQRDELADALESLRDSTRRALQRTAAALIKHVIIVDETPLMARKGKA